jgi:hypothetical protein
MKEVLADQFKDHRDYKGVQGKNSGGKFISLKKDSQSHVPKNAHSLVYLLYAYGVSKKNFGKETRRNVGPFPRRSCLHMFVMKQHGRDQ